MKTPNRTTARRIEKAQPDLIGILTRIERKIDSLKALHTISGKEYLTTQEACNYLGCTRALIYQACKAGKLTKLKKDNGRTYYRQDELKSYIDHNGDATPGQDDSAQEAA